MLLDGNVKIWYMYSLTGDQIRVTPMGEVIGLDHGAVLDTIELYATDGEVKRLFEGVRMCHQIAVEFSKANE